MGLDVAAKGPPALSSPSSLFYPISFSHPFPSAFPSTYYHFHFFDVSHSLRPTVGELSGCVEGCLFFPASRMSRLLKWDGTEMAVPHELFLKSMRLTFSHWTKHAAVLAAGLLWSRNHQWSPKVTKCLLAGSVASYVWRVFSSHAGGHRYFAHLSYKTTKWFELAMAMTIQVCAVCACA